MLEYHLTKNCYATLDFLRVANVFSIKRKVSYKEISDLNRLLNKINIYVVPLKISSANSLIYVYNEKKLCEYLGLKNISCFLAKYGYNTNINYSITKLKNSLSNYDCFPHEIGIFLGYPLEDVKGFIDNKGKNYIFFEYWKVYDNEKQRREDFKKFKESKKRYLAFTENNTPLSEIIKINTDKLNIL